MAAFPTYPQAEGTMLRPRSAVRNRYASNLRVRPRAIASAAFFDPVVVWKALSSANMATFMTFYSTNQAANNITYTHQVSGASITCAFDDQPMEFQGYLLGPGVMVYDVKVYLRQAV